MASVAASPATVRALHRAMWGFLFFLPPLSACLDVLGWLVLLWAMRTFAESRPERPRLMATVWCGLAVAGVRIGAVTVGILPQDTILLVPSLALAAAVLWQLCDLIIPMADYVQDRTLARQARRRRVLYVAQALLPLPALVATNAIRSLAGSLAAIVAYLLAAAVITTLVLAFLANAASMCRAAMVAAPGEGRAKP